MLIILLTYSVLVCQIYDLILYLYHVTYRVINTQFLKISLGKLFFNQKAAFCGFLRLDTFYFVQVLVETCKKVSFLTTYTPFSFLNRYQFNFSNHANY